MNGNSLEFTNRFVDSVVRQCAEFDPTGYDDGILRRWVNSETVMQLKPVKIVGTQKGVQHKRDDLIRPQYKRDKGRSLLHNIAASCVLSLTLDTRV